MNLFKALGSFLGGHGKLLLCGCEEHLFHAAAFPNDHQVNHEQFESICKRTIGEKKVRRAANIDAEPHCRAAWEHGLSVCIRGFVCSPQVTVIVRSRDLGFG